MVGSEPLGARAPHRKTGACVRGCVHAPRRTTLLLTGLIGLGGTDVVPQAGQLSVAHAKDKTDLVVASHLVTRRLSRDGSAVVPVHPGGRLTVKAEPDETVTLVWMPPGRTGNRKLRFVSIARGQYAMRFPRRATIPPEARIRVDRATYQVRLRRHMHRAIRTYPFQRYIIDWAYAPRSLREFVRNSRHAVFAEVIAVRDGPPENVDEPGHDIEEVPSQRIDFRVIDRWFGDVGRRFTLYKTGSQDGWGEGDPPFAVGESDVIFLGRRRPDGAYLRSAIHGRLRLESGVLRPFIEGPVARRLAWLTVGEARSVVRRLRRPGRS